MNKYYGNNTKESKKESFHFEGLQREINAGQILFTNKIHK
jgi:hypothetical protein